jgi:hypothetical protein
MRVFLEEQRFTQTWLIVLMTISTIVPILILTGTYLDDPEQLSLEDLVLFIVAMLLVFGLVFLFKLTTRIDKEGIHYKFYPIHLSYKLIKWDEIDKAYIRTYEALSEYGGWGLKGGALWSSSKGKAINISGNIGIQLELKTGKKLLIGTQKKEEATQIIRTYTTNAVNDA